MSLKMSGGHDTKGRRREGDSTTPKTPLIRPGGVREGEGEGERKVSTGELRHTVVKELRIVKVAQMTIFF